jgi:hypothetical protein
MRLKLEIDWIRFAILCGIQPYWTRWFLPINLTISGYLTSCEITLSVLWTAHFGVRIPLFRPNRRAAKQYLPRYK